MKCRYKYCKNNNQVDKSEAIKVGNAYYCKECYKEKTLKQQIEKYYLDNFPQTTIQILRKVINELLYKNNYEAEYILFILEKIYNNKLKLNNPFGIKSYCNEGRNIDEWNKIKINKKFNKMKRQFNQYDIKNDNIVHFTYKSNNKKWTDII